MLRVDQMIENVEYKMGGDGFHPELRQGFIGIATKIYADGSADIMSQCGRDQTLFQPCIDDGSQWVEEL